MAGPAELHSRPRGEALGTCGLGHVSRRGLERLAAVSVITELGLRCRPTAEGPQGSWRLCRPSPAAGQPDLSGTAVPSRRPCAMGSTSFCPCAGPRLWVQDSPPCLGETQRRMRQGCPPQAGATS